MIKRIFCLSLCFLAAIFLDAALLSRLVPYVVRPCILMALVLALSASFSLWTANIAAAVGGLAEDLLCSEAIGLTPAAMLIAAAILSSVLHKNTFKKGVLYLIMTGCVFLTEGVSAVFFRLYGAEFDALYTFFFGGLGRSLATAACALAFISLCNELKKGRIERA